MRYFDVWGRRCIIGVVFWAATAALCVDAEGQQRARRSGNRPTANNNASTQKSGKAPVVSDGMITKPKSSAASSAEKETATEENAPKPTASTATPETENGEGTTTFKKDTRASVESSDGEETLETLQTNDGENDVQYSSAPLDRTAIKLPSGYRGHNIKAITGAIAKIFNEGNVEKDEYEKTADYQKRISTFKEELPTKSLYGDLTFGSWLALALPPSEEGIGVQARYDADAEKFRIVFNSEVDYCVFTLDDSLLHGIKFSDVKTSSETYVGENLYGVKKEIRECNYVSHGVVFTDSSNLKLDDREILVLSGIAPSEAKEIGGSLGVLCVFKLFCVDEISGAVETPNCSVYGFWQHEATMSEPYEFSELQIAARVTIPECWVYNVETGQVFAKYSLQEMKTGKAKSIGDFELGSAPSSGSKVGETADELRKRIVAGQGEDEEVKRAELEAKQAADIVRDWRRAAQLFQAGERSRIGAAKKMKPIRENVASITFNVPRDCADLHEAIRKAEEEFAKKPNTGPIPRIVLDAGEYDASGLALKTFVDVQSASGKPEDVVLTVDAAKPMTVDGETVASFDGVTLRQVGGGKTGACVEVKRGIALLCNCVLDGKKGAASATGVKAVGLKSAAVLQKCRATDFALSALHLEDGAFGWAVETVFGPKNRFGASSKAARLEVEKCEFRGNETALYYRGIASGGASGNQYADNKRDAQIVDGAKVEVDAPNVERK